MVSVSSSYFRADSSESVFQSVLFQSVLLIFYGYETFTEASEESGSTANNWWWAFISVSSSVSASAGRVCGVQPSGSAGLLQSGQTECRWFLTFSAFRRWRLCVCLTDGDDSDSAGLAQLIRLRLPSHDSSGDVCARFRPKLKRVNELKLRHTSDEVSLKIWSSSVWIYDFIQAFLRVWLFKCKQRGIILAFSIKQYGL